MVKQKTKTKQTHSVLLWLMIHKIYEFKKKFSIFSNIEWLSFSSSIFRLRGREGEREKGRKYVIWLHTDGHSSEVLYHHSDDDDDKSECASFK